MDEGPLMPDMSPINICKSGVIPDLVVPAVSGFEKESMLLEVSLVLALH